MNGGRMRAYPRGRSSNREGTWSAAHLEVGGQAGGKIPEAGEGTQDGRERACKAVTNSVQTLKPERPTRYRLRRSSPHPRSIRVCTAPPWEALLRRRSSSNR